MFYATEILAMKKKGKLARCWLVATLSERTLKKVVSKKEISSIDIEATCDEILKFIIPQRREAHLRLSLYTASQLMYGASKLLKIQTLMLQESLFHLRLNIVPNILTTKKGKQTEPAIMIDCVTLPDPPSMSANLKDLQLKEDLHLLPEVDLEMIRTFNRREYVESLEFGALTEPEIDLMLENDWNIRIFGSPNKTNYEPNEESSKLQRLADNTTDVLALSKILPAIEQCAEADRFTRFPRTPEKRGSTAINLDTPTKRLRRNLNPEMNAAINDTTEEFPKNFQTDLEPLPLDGLAKLPADEAIVQPPEEFVELLANLEIQPIDRSGQLPIHAGQPQEPAVDMSSQTDVFLRLEPLEMEEPQQRRRRRTREFIRIDENTELPEQETGKAHCSEPRIYTNSRVIIPVPPKRRGISARELLSNPSMGHRRFGVTKWPVRLMKLFKKHTEGPFSAENDNSLDPEAARFAESGSQLAADESSKRAVEPTTILEASSKNKTNDIIPDEHGTIVAPPIPEVSSVMETANDLPLHDIADQSMFHDISESREDENLDGPKTVSVSKLPPTDVRTSVTTNGQSTSQQESGDLDGFLPPKLRKPKSERITGAPHGSSPKDEAIVDITESPEFRRSQQSPRSTWTKPELLAYLSILWRDNRTVQLTDLLPPDTTRRIDAALCFNFLLQLAHEGYVVLDQNESFGPIYITQKTTTTRYTP